MSHKDGAVSRRSYLKGTLAAGAMTSLAGCALLDGDLGGDDDIDGIPDEPFRIAHVTFRGGLPAFYGDEAVNALEMLVDQINDEGGLLGEREIVIEEELDESAGADSLISDVQSMAQGDDVDLLVGMISSANALAVAPQADDNELPFLVTTPGTYQLYEENPDMDYVVRTCGTNAAGAIGGARMVEQMDDVETIATHDHDYAWGHDHQEMFVSALENIRPDIEIVEERYTELGETDYSGHVSAIANAEPDLVFSSLWGGDAMTFASQGVDEGMFEAVDQALLVGDTGAGMLRELGDDMPENAWLGGRAGYQPNYRYEEDTHHQEFVDDYHDQYDQLPGWGAYHEWIAVQALEEAVERAVSIIGSWPNDEQLMAAMQDLSFEAPHGQHTMRGPQAATPAVFGRPTDDHDFDVDHKLLTDYEFINAAEVNPPVDMQTMDWVNEVEPL